MMHDVVVALAVAAGLYAILCVAVICAACVIAAKADRDIEKIREQARSDAAAQRAARSNVVSIHTAHNLGYKQ